MVIIAHPEHSLDELKKKEYTKIMEVLGDSFTVATRPLTTAAV